MILKERGALGYNDSIQQFFPDFPYHNITIRMLLTHRSGLPNYIYFFDKLLTDNDMPINNVDIIDSLTKYNPIWYYPPNTKFDYSNTGYAVLAAIVEKISGQTFEQFLQTEIFDSLQMSNTYVYNTNGNTSIPNAATGYLYRWKMAEDNFADGIVGDKGIYTSIDDMFLWDNALRNATLVSDSTLNEAFLPGSKDKKGKRNYGFGWRLKTLADSTIMIYHGGWWHGFQNLHMHMKDEQTTIIIFRNRKTKAIVNKQRLFDILCPENKYAYIVDTISVLDSCNAPADSLLLLDTIEMPELSLMQDSTKK